jgi:hypothetical protein
MIAWYMGLNMTDAYANEWKRKAVPGYRCVAGFPGSIYDASKRRPYWIPLEAKNIAKRPALVEGTFGAATTGALGGKYEPPLTEGVLGPAGVMDVDCLLDSPYNEFAM